MKTNLKKRYDELTKDEQYQVVAAFIKELKRGEQAFRRVLVRSNPDMVAMAFFARHFGVPVEALIEPDTEKKTTDQTVTA